MRCHPIIPCSPPARQPGNRLPAARRGRVKKFSKIFFVFALKKEVDALLWQNGNEITFRETELAFLIRLFTGYLQLYPTHTKLLLALQRLRDTARARSLLNAVFSFERNNTARDCFRPGRFSVFPFWRRSAVRLESLSLCGEGFMGQHWSSGAETELPWCVMSGNTASASLGSAPSRQGEGNASAAGVVTPAAPAAGCPPRRRAQHSAGRQTRRASRAWTRR